MYAFSWNTTEDFPIALKFISMAHRRVKQLIKLKNHKNFIIEQKAREF